MTTIAIKRLNRRIIAYVDKGDGKLATSSEQWAGGATVKQAIGELIMTYPETFGVVIVDPNAR